MSLLDKIRGIVRKPRAQFNNRDNIYTKYKRRTNTLSIRDYYKLMSNTWVNACISVKTNEIINLGYDIINPETGADTSSPEEEYVNSLFRKPMGSGNDLTFEKLISLVCTSHMGLGDAFVECIFDDDGLLTGFNHVPVEYMGYDYDEECFCLNYDSDVKFPDDELIHVYNPPIDGTFWGVSPLDILLDDLVLEKESRKHAMDILLHGGLNPSNAIEYDSDLDDDEFLLEFERLQEQARSGRTRNSTLILKGGEYKSIGFSPKDMEYTELQKDIRDRILAVYQVPPSKVDVFESANLGSGRDTAQAENFKKVLFSETNLIAGEFNRILEEHGFESRLVFRELDIEDKKERATIENMQLQSGVLTINEVRDGYCLDPVPWGDTPSTGFNTGSELIDEAEQELNKSYKWLDYYDKRF